MKWICESPAFCVFVYSKTVKYLYDCEHRTGTMKWSWIISTAATCFSRTRQWSMVRCDSRLLHHSIPDWDARADIRSTWLATESWFTEDRSGLPLSSWLSARPETTRAFSEWRCRMDASPTSRARTKCRRAMNSPTTSGSPTCNQFDSTVISTRRSGTCKHASTSGSKESRTWWTPAGCIEEVRLRSTHERAPRWMLLGARLDSRLNSAVETNSLLPAWRPSTTRTRDSHWAARSQRHVTLRGSLCALSGLGTLSPWRDRANMSQWTGVPLTSKAMSKSRAHCPGFRRWVPTSGMITEVMASGQMAKSYGHRTGRSVPCWLWSRVRPNWCWTRLSEVISRFRLRRRTAFEAWVAQSTAVFSGMVDRCHCCCKATPISPTHWPPAGSSSGVHSLATSRCPATFSTGSVVLCAERMRTSAGLETNRYCKSDAVLLSFVPRHSAVSTLSDCLLNLNLNWILCCYAAQNYNVQLRTTLLGAYHEWCLLWNALEGGADSHSVAEEMEWRLLWSSKKQVEGRKPVSGKFPDSDCPLHYHTDLWYLWPTSSHKLFLCSVDIDC